MRPLSKLFSLYLVLIITGCSSVFYHPSSETFVSRSTLSPQPEDLYFQSSSGAKLHAWLFRHRSSEPTRAALLYFHGNGENLSLHYRDLYWLLDNPYDFMIFDYEGYGESEGSPSPQSTVQDGYAALDLISKKYPSTPLIVYGQSLGGIIAARVLAEYGQKYPVRMAIFEATFSSYREVGQKFLEKHFLTWPFQWIPALALSDEWAAAPKLKSFPKIRSLVLHAEGDPIVASELGRSLYENLPEPKEFISAPGNIHMEGFIAGSNSYRNKVVEALWASTAK